MKTTHIIMAVMGGCLLLSLEADAQILKKLEDRIKKKAEDRVEKEVDKKAEQTMDAVIGEGDGKTGNPGSGGSKDFLKELPKTVYDFVPGNQVIFQDDFSEETVGSMPKKWRSSGTGSVVVGGNLPPGKWLHLAKGNVYRILDLKELPQNFTISFDLYFDFESLSGAAGGSFGLARNNKVGSESYSNNVAWITLEGTWWWRHNSIGFGGEAKKKSKTYFPTVNYAGRTMRVEIEITNGNWMKVFIDKHKVADTNLMYPESAKYFYINGPSDLGGKYDRYCISNVRIAEIVPGIGEEK